MNVPGDGFLGHQIRRQPVWLLDHFHCFNLGSRGLRNLLPLESDRILEGMSGDLEEQVHRRVAQRFEVLQALYRRKLVDYREPKISSIARDLNRDLHLTFEHLDFLHRHRLVLLRPGPPELATVLITHEGEVAVERVVSGQATPEFPLHVQNYIYVRQTHQPQIQQGTHNTTAAPNFGSFDTDGPRLKRLLESIRDALDEPGLDPEVRADLERALKAADVQVQAARPDRRALREAFKLIRSTAKRADSEIFVNHLPAITEFLRSLI